MEFVIDTRELKSYSPYFDKLGHSYTIETLRTGDYGIHNYPSFAIERKSLDDFNQSITRSRKRFERELERAKELEFFAVLIEASIYDIQNRKYKSRIHPNSILSTMFHWTVKYKIPFLLVESRTGGALAVIEMAKAYIKYKNEQHKEDI